MNNTAAGCLANVAVKMVLCGLLFFAPTREADAGPAPLPLEARLDTAKYVFVGQVINRGQSSILFRWDCTITGGDRVFPA